MTAPTSISTSPRWPWRRRPGRAGPGRSRDRGGRGRPRPWVVSTSGPIDAPDDATALIEGLTAYGA